jgi:peptide/nickel transport system permease protein
MTRYAIRRLLIAIPTLWGITIMTFTFVNLAPGDPLSAMMMNAQGQRTITSQAEMQALRAKYGLDQPAPVRYVIWLNQVLHGNLGQRVIDQQDVATVIGQRVGPTLELMCSAILLAIVLGIALGVISALRQYSRLDYLLTLWAFVGISLPEFFAGIILIYLLAVKLGWVPTSGMMTSGGQFNWGDNLQHLIMPALALALGNVSTLMRYTRMSVLDVVHQEFVITARAKGLAEAQVVLGHVFRNALLPLITIIGLMVPSLVSGAIVIESIFQWPGMGTLYLDAVQNRDYATIMGLALITATTVLLSNLVADLAYAVADPRIRYT